MKHKPNAIVVCCTPNWLPYAACTLKSCVDQGGSRVADLYVICMGVTERDRKSFAAFLARHCFSATLIDGELPEKLVKNSQKRFSAAAFLRLTLNEILAPDYQRVLYLDSDILALSPMASLFDIELGGKPLELPECLALVIVGQAGTFIADGKANTLRAADRFVARTALQRQPDGFLRRRIFDGVTDQIFKDLP